jgi:hypothetical protein
LTKELELNIKTALNSPKREIQLVNDLGQPYTANPESLMSHFGYRVQHWGYAWVPIGQSLQTNCDFDIDPVADLKIDKSGPPVLAVQLTYEIDTTYIGPQNKWIFNMKNYDKSKAIKDINLNVMFDSCDQQAPCPTEITPSWEEPLDLDLRYSVNTVSKENIEGVCKTVHIQALTAPPEIASTLYKLIMHLNEFNAKEGKRSNKEFDLVLKEIRTLLQGDEPPSKK